MVIGILAHVDAGKTTLSESMLYLSGNIRTLGRVDYKNAFLDTYELERERGITIFSKQAVFPLGEREAVLLDTPGHVDFSAEMERTLQVLDAAVLVISGSDGVQAHTRTLWRLLDEYQIPVFVFINKMDQAGTDRENLLRELKHKLDHRCVDFNEPQESSVFMENLALCDEELLERYLENGAVGMGDTIELIARRKVFPCYFGSALKLSGVKEFMEGLKQYLPEPVYSDVFAAKVYKITRDPQGMRLTHMKITGGSLKVKAALSYGEKREKADQVRIYSGEKYESVKEVCAGQICAVTGLSATYPGQGLGGEPDSGEPLLEPVLTYRMILPPQCDVPGFLKNLRQLEEEEPQMHIVWNEHLNEIQAQLMGEVQTKILQDMIFERFGIPVEFGSGNIVYKETIAGPVEGVGHFEPLRHYAEVHLLLEPGERGSGLQFASSCSEDILDKNWQRLILTHLREKKHKGVLTGSDITDMKITLAAGRAHIKHTEGGDFREATYRAVRQGLNKAQSILLEPFYQFRLEIPRDLAGRAMADIQRMSGSFDPPVIEEDQAVITGMAPVIEMRDYPKEVISYTKGRGRIFCSVKGYEPCHNPEEALEAAGYEADRDTDNPAGSVFCSHGAGFTVEWDKVEEYMHIESVLKKRAADNTQEQPAVRRENRSAQDDKELEEIFVRTYGPIKRYSEPVKKTGAAGGMKSEEKEWRKPKEKEREEYLLVDGYNIIFSWEELKDIAETNMEGARNLLMDILCNYQGFRKCTVILVFDAYRVEGGRGELLRYHGIHVVYTKEAETADQYIEKTVHEIGRKHSVTVATSDQLEQVIILGQGAARMSAQGLKEEIQNMKQELHSEYLNQINNRNYLFDNLPKEMADLLENVRLGKEKLDDNGG